MTILDEHADDPAQGVDLERRLAGLDIEPGGAQRQPVNGLPHQTRIGRLVEPVQERAVERNRAAEPLHHAD